MVTISGRWDTGVGDFGGNESFRVSFHSYQEHLYLRLFVDRKKGLPASG